MTFRFPLVFLPLLAFLAISACSSSDSGSANTGGGGLIGQPQALDQTPDDQIRDDDPQPPPTGTSPELQAIAGLWNNSVAQSDGGAIDVFYLEITAAGAWNNFDYRGDNVDQGANCYVLNTGQISSRSGSAYRVTFADGVLDFNAQVTNGRLVLTGNLGTVTLPAVIGLSPVDFNLC